MILIILMASSTMTWFYRRQYLPIQKYENNVFCANQFLESFSSVSQDVYHIEGEMGMALPPFMAKFSSDLLNGHMVGVADEDGHITLIDTSKTKPVSVIKEWAAHSNAVFDFAWINEEPKIVTGSGDQTARLWDVEKTETLAIFRGHTCSLKSVSVQPKCSSIFLTGARDGKIMLWDTRSSTRCGYSKPINIISNAHSLPEMKFLTPSGKTRRTRRTANNSDSRRSVTSVVFQDSYTFISAGACDGNLKYWDTRKTYTNHKSDPIAVHVIPFPGKGPRTYGYSSLTLNSTASRLYAVCTNDIIYEYATSNLSTSPLSFYHGHMASSFYIKATVSPDDRFLLCGSGDNDAYIWQIDQPTTCPWLLKGHMGEVTSVAWSPGAGEKIVTCSDDNSFKIWRLFHHKNNDGQFSAVDRCERKTKLKPIETPTEAIVQNDILVKSFKKCYCQPISMTCKKRWVSTKVLLSKDSPVVQTPDLKVTPILTTTPDLTITITPHRVPLTSTTPQRSLPTLSTPKSSKTRSSRSRSTTTPRSSRLFMESWLKSPVSPFGSNETSKDSCDDFDLTYKQSATENLCNFQRKRTCTSADEKAIPKVEIIQSIVMCSNVETKISANVSSSTLNTTPKLEKCRKSMSRRRKNQSTPNHRNIKALILFGKRKREGSENSSLKQAKVDIIDLVEGCMTDVEIKKTPENNKATNSVAGVRNLVVKDLLDHADESTFGA